MSNRELEMLELEALAKEKETALAEQALPSTPEAAPSFADNLATFGSRALDGIMALPGKVGGALSTTGGLVSDAYNAPIIAESGIIPDPIERVANIPHNLARAAMPALDGFLGQSPQDMTIDIARGGAAVATGLPTGGVGAGLGPEVVDAYLESKGILPPTSTKERVGRMGEGFGTEIALKGAGKATKFFGEKLRNLASEDTIRRLRKRGFGTLRSDEADIGRNRKEISQGVVQSHLDKSYQTLEKDGFFKDSRLDVPEKEPLVVASRRMDNLNGRVNGIVTDADVNLQQRGISSGYIAHQVDPTGQGKWTAVDELLNDSSTVPAYLKDPLRAEFESKALPIVNAVGNAKEPISEIVGQKRGLYAQTRFPIKEPLVENLGEELRRAMASDLRRFSEEFVDNATGNGKQLASLNKHVGAYYDWYPVIAREAQTRGLTDLVDASFGSIGVRGMPFAAGAVAGVASGSAALGVATGQAAAAAQSSGGRFGIANGLAGAAPFTGSVGATLSGIGGIASSPPVVGGVGLANSGANYPAPPQPSPVYLTPKSGGRSATVSLPSLKDNLVLQQLYDRGLVSEEQLSSGLDVSTLPPEILNEADSVARAILQPLQEAKEMGTERDYHIALSNLARSLPRAFPPTRTGIPGEIEIDGNPALVDDGDKHIFRDKIDRDRSIGSVDKARILTELNKYDTISKLPKSMMRKQ